jgi:hypothetical protein
MTTRIRLIRQLPCGISPAFVPPLLFPFPGRVRSLIRGARGHGLPSRLDRRLSQGACGHPPRSNEIHETLMSKIQEVARHGRTAVSGYSAANLLWPEGRMAESGFPAGRNRFGPPNALSELFSLRTVRDQVGTSPGRARRGTKREMSKPLSRCCSIFSRRPDHPMTATHLVWMLRADAH